MALTPAQLNALKTLIQTDPELSLIGNTTDGNVAIAVILNQAATPTRVVWRTRVSRREILQNDLFDWTRLDNLSVGKARIWTDIFVDGTINPSKANVRSGISTVWTGTAPDVAVRDAILAQCKKNATRAQALFSAGTGTTLSPATLDDNIEEDFLLTFAHVDDARNRP